MRKYYLAALVAFLSNNANAQHELGVATGNWSGTQSMYLNPANIADSRQRLVIDIGAANVGVDNNLGSISSFKEINDAIKDGNTNTLFSYTGKNTFSMQAPYATVRGPGAMYALSPRHSIALSSAIRGANQFNNFDKTLYRTIADPTYTTGSNLDLTSSKFNYTAHLWTEIGLTYAAVLVDQDEHVLKAGVTVRYLGGVGYVALRGNNLDAHYTAGNSTLVANNSDLQFASNILTTKGALQNGFSNNSIFSQFFGSKSGMGVGGDVGVVYEYVPDPHRRHYNMDGADMTDYSDNRYVLRLSAAVTDIGSIKYKAENNANATVTGNGTLTGQGIIDNVRSFDDFRRYAVRQGFRADTTHADTRVYMPTTIKFGADYHVYRHYYVNATYIGNVANRQNFGNSYYNQVTVTPRYDTRLFSAGIPVTYSALTNKVNVGVGLRVSGFFVGSDNVLAAALSGQYGFNLYAGGFVPFGYRRARDSDGDGISDALDRCPYEAGSIENHGCPEKGSGEMDSDDDGPAKKETEKKKSNSDED